MQVRQAPASLVLREIHSVGPEVISGMKPKRCSVPDNYCSESENADENEEENPDDAECHDSLRGGEPFKKYHVFVSCLCLCCSSDDTRGGRVMIMSSYHPRVNQEVHAEIRRHVVVSLAPSGVVD